MKLDLSQAVLLTAVIMSNDSPLKEEGYFSDPGRACSQ